MSEARFTTLLFVLVGDLIKRLTEDGGCARDAIRDFYRSKLYALLSDRETGLWHISTDMLLELYREERETGSFTLDWCV